MVRLGFFSTINWIFREYIKTIYNYILDYICIFIYKITYENGTDKTLTIRKAKRIRALTGFKLWAYKYFRPILNYVGEGEYLTKINKRFRE